MPYTSTRPAAKRPTVGAISRTSIQAAVLRMSSAIEQPTVNSNRDSGDRAALEKVVLLRRLLR
jgi:hypothetical protein